MDSTHIKPRERLSMYPQISTMMAHILKNVAGAGGLADEQGEAIYNHVMDSFATLNGDAFWGFRDEIIRMLATPDKEMDAAYGRD